MDSSVVVTSDAAAKRPGPANYPCVTRLRHRLLLASLLRQGFRNSFYELIHETDAYMSLRHLRGLVKQGQWVAAIKYLDTYLPPTGPRSFNSKVLRNFLAMNGRFANAVAGKKDTLLPKYYSDMDHGRAASHAELRLRSITFSILTVDHIRASLDWEKIRTRASSVVDWLARYNPDLRYCTSLPTARAMPHHVIPIDSGLGRRRHGRHVKKFQRSSRLTRCVMRALKRQRRKASTTESFDLDGPKKRLADLLDQTIYAGESFRPLQISQKQGTHKHLSQGDCHTESACQDKNSRDELTPAEEDHDPKRQRTAGAFGEANSEEKRAMVNSAFGEDKTGGHATQRLTVEDLRYLFEI